MKNIFRFGILLALHVARQCGAQSLTVDWFTVDGGGGTSSDGALTIGGTIGQPDAGTMSDGTLAVQGGFWPAFTFAPTTSVPGGFQVYYSTVSSTPQANYIGVVNSDGSGNTHVLDSATWPRLSPDGGRLLYHPVARTDNFALNGIAMLDLATGQASPVISLGDYMVYYDWMRDGTNVVFDWMCGIYRVTTNGQNFTTLIQLDCYDDAPSVNPQDGTLAFHGSQGLMLANADGANRRHLANTANGDYWPNWSPDAQWLVFGTGSGYWKIKPDGSGRTNLWNNLPGATQATFNGSASWGPACFSPDQQWIIAAFNLDGTNGIYALAADGSGAIRTILTVGPPAQTYNFIGSVVATTLSPTTPPVLTIAPVSPGQVTVSWTSPTPGFALQSSDSLLATNWVTAPSGTNNPATVPATGPARFYRLSKP